MKLVPLTNTDGTLVMVNVDLASMLAPTQSGEGTSIRFLDSRDTLTVRESLSEISTELSRTDGILIAANDQEKTNKKHKGV